MFVSFLCRWSLIRVTTSSLIDLSPKKVWLLMVCACSVSARLGETSRQGNNLVLFREEKKSFLRFCVSTVPSARTMQCADGRLWFYGLFVRTICTGALRILPQLLTPNQKESHGLYAVCCGLFPRTTNNSANVKTRPQPSQSTKLLLAQSYNNNK